MSAILLYLKLSIPFLEAPADAWLIRNDHKDIPWYIRVAAVMAVSSHWDTHGVYINFSEASFAIALFAWFDPLLNILRAKHVNYNGKTKEFDKWLRRIKPFWEWTARVIWFVFFLWLHFKFK